MTHRKLVRDTFLTVITLITFGSTNFLFNVAIGRFFGSDFLGKVSTALSTSLLIGYIVSTSIPSAVAKYISECLGNDEDKKANYVMWMSLIYAILVGGFATSFTIVFAPSISDFFKIPSDIFLLFTPIILLYGLYMVLKMAYYGYRRADLYFKKEIFSDVLFFIVLAAIIFFKLKNYTFAPYIVLYSSFILLSIPFIRGKIKYKFADKQIKRKFFAFAGISFLGTFSSMAMRSLAIMLSSIYVPPNEVGYLSAAFSISAIFFLFPNAMGRVFMPEFSYHFGKGNKGEIIKLLNSSTDYLGIMVTIVNGLGIIFAPFIVKLFYSEEFLPSALILQILLFGFWFTMLGRPAVSVLSGTKYIHIPNIGGILGLSFAIFSWWFLIPTNGILGTVIGYVGGVIITMSYILYHAKKQYGLNIYNILIHFFVFVLIFLTVTSYMFVGLYVSFIGISFLVFYVFLFRGKISLILKKIFI